jgi:hypothetical protein
MNFRRRRITQKEAYNIKNRRKFEIRNTSPLRAGTYKKLFHTYLPMKMEQAECSETSAYKLHTPGNYPEEDMRHSEHGESLKSGTFCHRMITSGLREPY